MLLFLILSRRSNTCVPIAKISSVFFVFDNFSLIRRNFVFNFMFPKRKKKSFVCLHTILINLISSFVSLLKCYSFLFFLPTIFISFSKMIFTCLHWVFLLFNKVSNLLNSSLFLAHLSSKKI